jgi:membrane protein implicated in regulation of membrane protease activity|tara:strand:+ start:271 stop:729 length:459 start_codon:yes stop_codon:yes gene_type:complete
MNWISNNLSESLIMAGLALLVLEVVVLGFSTFVLFFVGLAAVVAGGLMTVGIVPDSMLSALSSVGVLTALLAIFLWRPLKSMQGNVESKKVTSDLVGHSFILNEAVSMTKNPAYRYSGIDWNLSSEKELSAGTLVEVTGVAVGKFIVQAKAL